MTCVHLTKYQVNTLCNTQDGVIGVKIDDKVYYFKSLGILGTELTFMDIERGSKYKGKVLNTDTYYRFELIK